MVAQCQDSTNWPCSGLQDGLGSLSGRLETDRDRLIAPGIFEPMAAIGRQQNGHAEFPCGRDKGVCLIAEFAGEHNQPALIQNSPTRRHTHTGTGTLSLGLTSISEANWPRAGSAQQYQGSVR